MTTIKTDEQNQWPSCCLCGGEIEVEPNGWGGGHNASPVIKNGRCCERCNWVRVIPARIKALQEQNRLGGRK